MFLQEKSSARYTAIVTVNGQFELSRCPFGLSNSPEMFQIHNSYPSIHAECRALCYKNDLIIPSADEKERITKFKSSKDCNVIWAGDKRGKTADIEEESRILGKSRTTNGVI